MAIVMSADRSVPIAPNGYAMSTSARLKGPVWPEASGHEGNGASVKLSDRDDPRGDTGFQFLCFARHRNKSAARLVLAIFAAISSALSPGVSIR